MKVRLGVQVHEFSDKSGVLFYNTFTEESTIVANVHCTFESLTNDDGKALSVLVGVSNEVIDQLVSKRFIDT